MYPSRQIGVVMIAATIVVAACTSTSSPSSPTDIPITLSAASGGGMAASNGGRGISMLDQCDPDSFNAIIGPGTCVNRTGGVTFDAFIALLVKQSRAPSWRFSPDTIHVPTEMTLPIANRGGEGHTFTQVAEFGGGLVPDLNELSGTPVPAPECLNFSEIVFIPAGGTGAQTFQPGGGTKYQCCIHPWMRAETR